MTTGGATPKKMFSIERRRLELAGDLPAQGAAGSGTGATDHSALLNAFANFKKELLTELRQMSGDLGHDGVNMDDLSDQEQKLLIKQKELNLVKNEIRALSFSIQSTKKEIATLYRAQSGHQNRFTVVTDELDTIVKDTESATSAIMDIAENIDDAATNIISTAESSYVAGVAEEISQNVVRMFESCNFQDLTGQRITKVINTMKMIDDRIQNIINIWGDDEFSTYTDLEADPTGLDNLQSVLAAPTEENEKVTQIEADDIMSQDDLDALFD